MTSKFLDYLKDSNEKTYNNPIGDRSLYGIRIYIKEPITDRIDLKGCFDYIFGRMPKKIYQNVERVMIGNFPFLNKRKVHAMYENGTIYLTNVHEDESTFISDMVHEVAHSFEEKEKEEIYKDEKIKNEFISKRQTLFRLLDSHGLINQKFTEEDFMDTSYQEKFDLFVHEEIGYETIGNVAPNLFVSPYGCTSLREYFANGFENFFVNDYEVVKKISPNVYEKIINFLEF